MDKEPHPRVKTVLDRVGAKMKARGDTLKDAADAMAVSYQQLWDWLNFKKGNPKPESLDKMEAYCELSDEKQVVEFK